MRLVQALVEAYVVPLQLMLAMFGMGARLTALDFVQVVREPKSAGVGLGLQLVFVPAFTLAFIETFGLEKGWASGLLLISVSPSGVFSNLLTFIGRGNLALGVAITATTTVASAVTVPALLSFLAGSYLPPEFEMPLDRITRDIALYLVVPLLAGMMVRRMDPGRAEPLSRWTLRIGSWLILVVTVSALGSGRIQLAAYGIMPPLLLSLFGTLVAALVPLLCRTFGRYDEDTVTLSIQVCVRNVGLALVLAQFFFPGTPEQGHVLYTVLYFGGMQLFMALPIALRHRHGHSAVLLLPRRPQPAQRSDAQSLYGKVEARSGGS
jgi:BASS family bile acid:Na+ symporter